MASISGAELTLTYQSDQDGSATVTVTATDTATASVPDTFNVTVTPINDAPVAANDAYEVQQDNALNVVDPANGVLANDTDVENNALSAVLVSDVSKGLLNLNTDGSFDYTPDGGFSGSDSFTYTAKDGQLDSNTATVTITVTPDAQPLYAVGETPVFGTVVGSFTDTWSSDDARQTITEVTYAGKRSRLEHVWDFGQVDGATKFVVEASRSDLPVDDFLFEYSTDGVNWITMIDGITTTDTVREHLFAAPISGGIQVRVTDTDRGKDPTLDTVYIDEMYFLCQTGPPNTPPVAGDDSATTVEDTEVAINVLENDTDPDGDPISIASLGTPGNGTLVDNDGTVTYTPDDDFNGTDTFTYTISDGNGGTDTATVTVEVTGTADDPIADAGGPYTVAVGGTVNLNASGSTDPDLPYGDTLAYTWDFDNDGDFDDATGVAPTFDATGLSDGTVVPIAVEVTDLTNYTSRDTTTVTVQATPSELIFDYLGGPKNIGDDKIVTTTIDISGTGVSIADLTVRLNLTHTNPSDLTAWLIAPDGTTTFTLGTPILDGQYDYGLPGAVGTDLDGVWTLKIEDSVKNRKRGTLIGWSMVVESAPIESAQSQMAAIDLALLALVDPDSPDDDETDVLTETLVDDLALVLFE